MKQITKDRILIVFYIIIFWIGMALMGYFISNPKYLYQDCNEEIFVCDHVFTGHSELGKQEFCVIIKQIDN